MSGDNGTALTVFEDGDMKTDTLAVRYYPLETEDTPDYTDVAAAYRNYLTEEAGVTNTVENTDPSLYLNFYGGTKKEKSKKKKNKKMKTSHSSFQQS